MDERKRSGKIPAFGDWERANDMPITQYFESARQAGLVRYVASSSSGELQHAHFNKPSEYRSTKQTQQRRREQRKQGKVYDVAQPQPQRKHSFSNPKPVDEDLYKIPPHLLSSNKPKKLSGFFSCLVPGCAS